MKIPCEVKRHFVPNEEPIREAMLNLLQLESGVIVEELKVAGGAVRIDIAVINSYLHGIELKSDGDSLTRLPRQVQYYNMVFEQMTIVTGFSHLYDVLHMVPSWWSVCVAELTDTQEVSIINIREGKNNPAVDPSAVADLLKRHELLEILDKLQISKGWRSKRNSLLYEFFVHSLDNFTLNQLVRQALIDRTFSATALPSM